MPVKKVFPKKFTVYQPGFKFRLWIYKKGSKIIEIFEKFKCLNWSGFAILFDITKFLFNPCIF